MNLKETHRAATAVFTIGKNSAICQACDRIHSYDHENKVYQVYNPKKMKFNLVF